MRKAEVIATCLVNSNIFREIRDAESAVQHTFSNEFPAQDYWKWNADIDDKAAEHIIVTVGRASRINVKSFIEDLWD